MEKITINTIKSADQRYETSGDYYFDSEGNRVINVSDMSNWKYEFLTAIHELIEISLCKDRGITDKMIDDFDFSHEKQREAGLAIGEPGDNKEAPYHKEHIFAGKIEKIVAEELNVDWADYVNSTEITS